MLIKNPFFSIVLPTYNRADILPLAIQSVLNQTFEDFELVISNGGSTDETRLIVSGIKDDRISYFESAEKLSMAQNYEFALNQAKGKFVVFFSDDDAFVPQMLAKVKRVIDRKNAQMVIFPFARYYHEDSEDSGAKRNDLEYAKFTGKVWGVNSSSDILRMWGVFGLKQQQNNEKKIHPLIGNVVFDSELLDNLRKFTPNLFATVPVDIYMISLVLAMIETYFVIDEPLLVWSEWDKNSSISKTKNLRKHYENLLDGKTLEYVPLKFALPTNCSANALLAAQRDISPLLDKMEVDWKWYFVQMHNYLVYLDGERIDVSNEMAELKTVLKLQPASTRNYYKEMTSLNLFRGRQILKKVFPSSLVKALRTGKNRLSDSVRADGANSGFQSVLESADFLATLLSVNDLAKD